MEIFTRKRSTKINKIVEKFFPKSYNGIDKQKKKEQEVEKESFQPDLCLVGGMKIK